MVAKLFNPMMLVSVGLLVSSAATTIAVARSGRKPRKTLTPPLMPAETVALLAMAAGVVAVVGIVAQFKV